MHRNGDKRVVLYNEFVAAQEILVDQAPLAKQAATIDWIENVADVLAALETTHHRIPLPTDLVQKLKTEGRLPSEAGLVAHWAQVKRSSKPIPSIPDVVEPDILYPRLSKLALLKDGQLKIPAFKLDDFISNLSFSKAGDTARQSFFIWLRKTHSDLGKR
jgi:hypothetical protein